MTPPLETAVMGAMGWRASWMNDSHVVLTEDLAKRTTMVAVSFSFQGARYTPTVEAERGFDSRTDHINFARSIRVLVDKVDQILCPEADCQ